MNKWLLTFRSLLFRSGSKRARWLKKKNLFGSIGENNMMQPWKIPLHPHLIYLANNVRVASNVTFVTHDAVHSMLNNLPPSLNPSGTVFKEMKQEIHVGDNVFIGANSIILYGVTIGTNVIVGAGSVVVKDLPDNSVCAGVPCKKVSEFSDFVEKRKDIH